MPLKSYFIAGTDTGSGKTLASIGLMQAIRAAGREVYGMKPVASGCSRTVDGLVSEDALLIQKNCSQTIPYPIVNPIALEPACSPNIAAMPQGKNITPAPVLSAYQEIPVRSGYLIMEGIGGWRTPVFGSTGMEIIVRQLGIPVILVVGLRLGCISHALLTMEAIYNDNIALAGWIANAVDSQYGYGEETVAFLKQAINKPLLGEIPYMGKLDLDRLGQYLSVLPILE